MEHHAGAGPLADYAIGQRVMTREGFAGKIDDILEGPGGLTTYWITLEGGMGGGEYAEGEVWPAEQRSSQLASVEHTAADDYPELGSILSDRLPPQLRTTTAGKQTPCVSCGTMLAEAGDGSWPEASDGSSIGCEEGGSHQPKTAAVPLNCSGCGETYFSDDIEGSLHDHHTDAKEAARRIALWLPPKAPSDQRASTTPLSDKQQPGYKDGFAHGKEGITRAPAHPEDADYMAGYDIGWAEGITVYREPADSWAQNDLAADQIAGIIPDPMGPMMAKTMTEHLAQMERRGGFMDFLEGKPSPDKAWKGPDRYASYDWCRFRRDSHCFLPKGLNQEASKIEGYAVWIPEDRGHCFRQKWSDQQKCPTGQPGPNTGPAGFLDATIPYEEGGQHGGIAASLRVRASMFGRWDVPAEPEYQEMFPGSYIYGDRFAALWYSKGTKTDPGGITIHAIQVEPSHQRRGLATQLLDDMAEHFKGHSVDPGGLTEQGAPLWHGWVQKHEWPPDPYSANGVYLEDPYGDDENGYAEGSLRTAESLHDQFEQHSPSTYVNDNWSVVIEQRGGEWVVEEHGSAKHREQTAEQAIDWAQRWLRGQTRASRDTSMKANAGGFRTAGLSTTADMHFTASWKDVQRKAKRIRSEGGVRLIANHSNTIVAHVKGDHGIYETEIVAHPAKRNVAYWHCGCKWSAYSWGRSGPWKRFEGRMCSHALAVQYEAQARSMFGRSLTLDEKQPSWMDQKHVHRPGDWDRDTQRYTSLEATKKGDGVDTCKHCGSDNLWGNFYDKDGYGTPDDSQGKWDLLCQDCGKFQNRRNKKTSSLRPVYDQGEDDPAPTTLLAHAMLSEGQPYKQVRAMLLAHGVDRPVDIVKQARSADFRGKVRGLVMNLRVDEDGVKTLAGELVPIEEVVYPGYHPTYGLSPADTVIDKSAAKEISGPAQEGVYYHVAPYRDWPSIRDSGLRSLDGHSPVWVWNNVESALHYSEGYSNPEVPPCIVVIRTDRAYLDTSGIWSTTAYRVPDAVRKDEVYDVIRPEDLHLYRTSAKKDDGPQVSGVALVAADTGRVLMLQRGIHDKKDPAAGTWEFPGGHHEEGDTTSLHAGIREWQEEVGQKFPEGGYVAHTWSSPDGIYQGHVVVIPEEANVVLHDGRSEGNPDDPKGDKSEQAAWWLPEHAKKNPALRPECKGSPWHKMVIDKKTAVLTRMMPVSRLLEMALPRSSDAVDEDKVQAYAQQMRESGYDEDWADAEDDHVRVLDGRVLNGNHRIHAADEAGVKHLPVEVLTEGHFGSQANKGRGPQNYQIIVKHPHQDTPLKHSFHSSDTAFGWAHRAHEAGAEIAQVIRKSDGKVLWDGPAGIDDLESDWHQASLTKQADEDQCPRCAGDSLAGGRGYVCQDCGWDWAEDDPEAVAFHGDGPGSGIPFGSLPEVSYDEDAYPSFVPAHEAKSKDTSVPPSEHGDPRMQDAGVSVSKTKDGKYYVHTHRARGKYRDSVADIPDSEIEYIRSTGSAPAKEGTKMDIPDEFGSLFDGATADLPQRMAAAPVADDPFAMLPTFTGTQHEEPEPALPTTDGADEDDEREAWKRAHRESAAARVAAALGASAATPHQAGLPLCPKCGHTVGPGDVLEIVAGVGLQHKGACPSAGRSAAISAPVAPGRPESEQERGARLLAQVDARLRGEAVEGPDPFAHLLAGQADHEAQQAAQRYLASHGGLQTEALKTYSPAERKNIIDEGEGVTASNLDRLDIKGTHYEALEAHTGARSEDEDLWMLDGDPNGPDM